MKHILFQITIALLIIPAAISQQQMTVEEYIKQYKYLAIREMQLYHIPASITMAQAIHESSNGNSPLAIEANNHFGIKCHKEWTGPTYIKDDEEKNECFRKYRNVAESYRDHSLFLTTRERYIPLFSLEITDYNRWAEGLKHAGYATNPKYPQILVRIIDENKLYELDQEAINGNVEGEALAGNSLVSDTVDVVDFIDYRNDWISQQLVPLEIGGLDRQVYKNNGVKCIIAREGDNFYNIASEFGIYHRQIYTYNELGTKDSIIPGEVIYIEPKKKKGSQESHKVFDGESLRDVSQRYGIKLKDLQKINILAENDQLTAGQVIKLR
jgi:hypothetical protein